MGDFLLGALLGFNQSFERFDELTRALAFDESHNRAMCRRRRDRFVRFRAGGLSRE